MKTILAIVFLAAISATQTHGQVELKDLRAPVSPGFTLLDETPSSVDKPSTPSAFGVSLLNLATGGAVEVAPYWLKSHSNLSFETYGKAPVPILYTLSVSAATQIKNDSAHLAFGLRFHAFRWRSDSSQAKLDRKAQEIREILNEDPEDIDQDRLAELKKEFEAMLEKPTILVSFAAAYASLSPNTEFKDLQNSRYGAWINIDYCNSKLPDFHFILLNRYLKNPNFSGYTKDSEMYDVGGSILYKKKWFGASTELVKRLNLSGTENYQRLAGMLEFRLVENLYLSGTMGKNFNEKSDLFVLFGINVGVSAKSSVGLNH